LVRRRQWPLLGVVDAAVSGARRAAPGVGADSIPPVSGRARARRGGAQAAEADGNRKDSKDTPAVAGVEMKRKSSVAEVVVL
jgi:hypothetical protein